MTLVVAVRSCTHTGVLPRAPAPMPIVRKLVVAPAWNASDRARLKERFALARASIGSVHAGFVVCDLHGHILYAANERMPLIPASTLKTVVAATSWFTLGPAYRFETRIVSSQTPKNGEIAGDLGLIGSGDPILTSDDLRAGVGVLWRAGLRRVGGGVLVDATRFSGPEQNRTWSAGDLEFGFAAGTSAISLDQNTVEFDVTPTTPGAPALMTLEPHNTIISVSGEAMTHGYGGYNTLSIERGAAPNSFVVSGGIPAGAMQRYWRTISDIPLYAGDVLRGILKDRGIRVEGAPQVAEAALAGQTLWLHRSPPLAALERQMLVESNNHFAEQLLRTLGAECCKSGTESAGVGVERAFLARRGIPLGGFHAVDGSGLSDRDRVSALTLATLLARVDAEDIDGRWLAAFPLAGKEGTLRYRSLGAAAGRVRAKSGYIEGASGLVGYVSTRHHGRIVFAFIVDDWTRGISQVFATEDGLLDTLADF